MWPDQGVVVEFVGSAPWRNTALASETKNALDELPRRAFGGKSPRMATAFDGGRDRSARWFGKLLLARMFFSPEAGWKSFQAMRSIESERSLPLRDVARLLVAVEESRRAREHLDVYLAERGALQHLWSMYRNTWRDDIEPFRSLVELHSPMMIPEIVVCVPRVPFGPQDRIDGGPDDQRARRKAISCDDLGDGVHNDVGTFCARLLDGTHVRVLDLEPTDAHIERSITPVVEEVLDAWGGETIRSNWIQVATAQGPYIEKAWWR